MPQIILVEKSAVIPVTPLRLYRAVTDAKQLSRWLADRVESDPRPAGTIAVHDDGREKRGVYVRLIPGVEVGIRWTTFDEPVPEDITGFKIDKVAQGARVRVVDFAVPEDAAAWQAIWTKRLQRLKKLLAVQPSPRKTSPAKRQAAPKAKSTTRKSSARKSKTK